MNEFYNNYLEGNYELGELYFIEVAPEWGIDFRVLSEPRDEYTYCVAFRTSSFVLDGDWEVGTFVSLSEAVEVVKESWLGSNEM